MLIITWSCQGAYRQKAAAIAALEPDIVVIAECENLWTFDKRISSS